MKRPQQKPRDPAADTLRALRRSGAMGAHGKTRKALRRSDKVKLRKELD